MPHSPCLDLVALYSGENWQGASLLPGGEFSIIERQLAARRRLVPNSTFFYISLGGCRSSLLIMSVALITGANVGLGFETARLLALGGYSHIVLACRSVPKSEQAAEELHKLLPASKVTFHALSLDLADVDQTRASIREFAESRTLPKLATIDTLILNAGLVAPRKELTPQGYELSWAASIAGHHVLVKELQTLELLSPEAHVVISGSEGARGTFPTSMMGMSVFDYASANLDDLNRGISPSGTFSGEQAYAHAKTYVAWWAAAFARRNPNLTVVCVSPGNTSGTEVFRNAGVVMKIMAFFMTYFGPFMGMSHSCETGARRYVDGAILPHNKTGKFLCSPNGWLTGALTVADTPHLNDKSLQEKAYELLEKL